MNAFNKLKTYLDSQVLGQPALTEGILLALLILPLYIPVLIFGAGAVYASSVGLDITGHFSLLGALLILALAFIPWVSAIAVKSAIE